jgi:hypothetical protein
VSPDGLPIAFGMGTLIVLNRDGKKKILWRLLGLLIHSYGFARCRT